MACAAGTIKRFYSRAYTETSGKKHAACINPDHSHAQNFNLRRTDQNQMEQYLNIGGSEWVIVVFVALLLILGTNRLPEAARKIGKAAAEYKKARDQVGSELSSYSDQNVKVTKPVENERQKFEAIAESLGINADGTDTKDLKEAIRDKIGQKTGDKAQ